MNVKQFFNSQFKAYANYDNERSIASVVDGQKTTMRKVLYACSLRSNTEIKVAQLSSQVAFETAYHHGEQGIGGVICNMAQDFVGANNMNFLQPIGQFGSRLSPVPAATRYIFTKLMPEFRQLFKKEDDLILEHLYDDDQKIEPKHYLPILPVVLINGTQGIGTGFASKVMQYNPKDLQADLIAVLTGKKRKKLVPWFRGFKGTVEQGANSNQWIISGVIEVVNTTTIRITELPVGTYLEDIKETLVALKEKELVKDYDDYSSDENGFDIVVTVPRTTTAKPIEELYKLFKLVSKESENLTLWNGNDKLQVFDDTSAIVDYFAGYRLVKYETRRVALIEQVEQEILDLDERIRFINFYLNNHQMFKATPKKELLDNLLAADFTTPEKHLSMAIWSLTKDKIEELEAELIKQINMLEALKVDTADKMFARELQELKL